MSNKRSYTPQQVQIIRGKKARQSNSKKSISVKQNSTTKLQNIDMHLAKIKSRYLFNSNKPEQEHTYAVYKDISSNEVRAVPATHLYLPDAENMSKLRKGLLCKVKFASYETPSGIENYYHNTDIVGKPIDLNHSDIKVDKTSLPQAQAQKIKGFAKSVRKI